MSGSNDEASVAANNDTTHDTLDSLVNGVLTSLIVNDEKEVKADRVSIMTDAVKENFKTYLKTALELAEGRAKRNRLSKKPTIIGRIACEFSTHYLICK